MVKLSWMTFAKGARQLVVQDALETVKGRQGITLSARVSLTDCTLMRGSLTDVVLGVVLVEVDTADVHGCIGRGSRDDDLLGTTLQVKSSLLLSGEDTGRFDYVVSTSLAPWNVGRVLRYRTVSQFLEIIQ